MFLNSIALSAFRNITSAELSFSSRIAVLVGGNGQGKTSLLEAIYLLSHSKSFRTSKSSELVSKLEPTVPTEVRAQLDTQDGEKALSFKFNKAKREVFLNDNRITAASDFYGVAKVIDFTPDDLFIVKGAPQERRRYLDKLLAIVDKEYLENLVRYQRALKNRNALLLMAKEFSAETIRKLSQDVSVWDEPLIISGEIIAKKRQALTEILNNEAMKIYSELSDSKEDISCSYKTNFKDDIDKATEYKKRFERDLRLKSTSFGIHRDDLIIKIDTGFGPEGAKEIASQGQTRSAALALKLAGIEYLRTASNGEDPIVLLDDVESELDQKRREFLLQYLLRINSQIFIATTSREALPGMAKIAQYFSVKEGKIHPH